MTCLLVFTSLCISKHQLTNNKMGQRNKGCCRRCCCAPAATLQSTNALDSHAPRHRHLHPLQQQRALRVAQQRPYQPQAQRRQRVPRRVEHRRRAHLHHQHILQQEAPHPRRRGPQVHPKRLAQVRVLERGRQVARLDDGEVGARDERGLEGGEERRQRVEQHRDAHAGGGAQHAGGVRDGVVVQLAQHRARAAGGGVVEGGDDAGADEACAKVAARRASVAVGFWWGWGWKGGR